MNFTRKNDGFTSILTSVAVLGLGACATPPATTGPIEVPVAAEKTEPTYFPTDGLRPRQRISRAMNLLDAGCPLEPNCANVGQAKAELNAVFFDANSRDRDILRAQDLVNQIDKSPEDYFAAYNGQTFAYRLRRGDSLGTIARECLGGVEKFYALARLNGIAAPNTLNRDLILTVPGSGCERKTDRQDDVSSVDPENVDGSVETGTPIDPIDAGKAALFAGNFDDALGIFQGLPRSAQSIELIDNTYSAKSEAQRDDGDMSLAAATLIENGDFIISLNRDDGLARALAIYEEALAIDPTNAVAATKVAATKAKLRTTALGWREQGLDFEAAGNCDAAIPLLEKAIAVLDADETRITRTRLEQCKTR